MIVEVKLWGTLVGYLSSDKDNNIYFTYDESFINKGIEISPIMMKLRKEPYSFPLLNKETFKGLPGLFADSLPDRFGRKVINEYLLSINRERNSFSPLEELTYIGTRGMGALEYYPLLDKSLNESDEIDINQIALAAKDVLRKREKEEVVPIIGRIRDIIKIGSSAGGAKAKAIVAYNEEKNIYKSGQIDAGKGFSYWIIKFDRLDKENPNSFFDSYQTREEYAYYLMAKEARINISESKLIKENDDYHFMTKRFDRYINEKGELQKLHMQTFCGLSHIDFVDKHNYSYLNIFQTMDKLNVDFEDKYELFRRMVFNVMAVNNDDHSKNFSFLMDKKGRWSLSPAYDLTYANDPNSNFINNHQCLINGKSNNITKEDLLEVGKKAGLLNQKMEIIFSQVKEAIKKWNMIAKDSYLPEEIINEDYMNFKLIDN